MSDELLRARIAFVGANISKMAELLEALGARKNHLADTQRFLGENADKLQKLTGDLVRLVDELTMEDAFDRAKMVESTVAELRGIMIDLRKQKKDLESGRSWLTSVSLETAGQPSTGRRELMRIKELEVTNLKNDLAKIQQMLDTPASPGAPTNGQDGPWQTFQKQVRTKAQDLFAEYVDLVGGLAVRDVGLDHDACRLADDLVRTYSLGPTQHLLTIPSRYRAASFGWGRVIRLGFPEWTVWTLPLVAQEFWFAAGRDQYRAEKVLDGLNVEDLAMQECLADAFGTFALGPAYAYAAILLRFDPFIAHEKQGSYATEDNRVHAVLCMLAAMSPPNEVNDFTGVRGTLERYWTEALAKAGPRDGPDAEEKKRIEAAVTKLAASMRAKDPNAGLTPGAWERFQTWAAKLRRGEEESIPVAGAELRWVLNAAWRARIEEPGADLHVLTERVQRLWNRVVEMTSPAPKGPRAAAQR